MNQTAFMLCFIAFYLVTVFIYNKLLIYNGFVLSEIARLNPGSVVLRYAAAKQANLYA